MSRRKKPRDPLLAVRYVDLMITAVAHRLITGGYPKKKLLALTLRRAGLGPDDIVQAETASTARDERPPIERHPPLPGQHRGAAKLLQVGAYEPDVTLADLWRGTR